MTDRRKVIAGLVGWPAAITGLHAYHNVDWSAAVNDYLPVEQRKFNVAYIPVT